MFLLAILIPAHSSALFQKKKFIFKNIYLFILLHRVLVATCRVFYTGFFFNSTYTVFARMVMESCFLGPDENIRKLQYRRDLRLVLPLCKVNGNIALPECMEGLVQDRDQLPLHRKKAPQIFLKILIFVLITHGLYRLQTLL